MATNSEQVKIFDRATKSCHILTGHGGIVLSLDVSCDGNAIVTSSKVSGGFPLMTWCNCELYLVAKQDNTIRVWRLDSATKCFSLVGIGTGHTQAVGAVAYSRYHVDDMEIL